MQNESKPLVGVLAWFAAALIGSAWQLATRSGVSTSLEPMDIVLLRYVIPAVLLLPVLIRNGFVPRSGDRWNLSIMVFGAGFPFGLLAITGAKFAPASDMGALLPGAMPVFVAILSFAYPGERIRYSRIAGLGVIVLGVAAIAGMPLMSGAALLSDGIWRGHCLFLAAGFLWAIYTVRYRRSSLSPWHATALVCFWSAVVAIPAWLASGKSTLTEVPMTDLVIQILVQGILAGIAGLVFYALAIRHLGAGPAAVSGAAVPPMTAIGGTILLAEPLPAATVAGVVLVAIGIALSAGAWDRFLKRYSLLE